MLACLIVCKLRTKFPFHLEKLKRETKQKLTLECCCFRTNTSDVLIILQPEPASFSKELTTEKNKNR